jgi:O-antigen/teichoic acid export membrane protein
VLIVLSVSGLGLAISQPAQYLLVGAERQRFYMAGMGLAAIVDVVGCLLLIPRYGALGAAMAKGAAQLVAAAIFLTYLQRGFGARLPVARMARLVLSGGAMLLCVLLFSHRVASILGLLLGIPLGAGIFVVLVRILRCLDVADRDRLRGLERLIPASVRHPYRSVVDFLVPA